MGTTDNHAAKRYWVTRGARRNGKRSDFDMAGQFGYHPPYAVTGGTPSSLGPIAG